MASQFNFEFNKTSSTIVSSVDTDRESIMSDEKNTAAAYVSSREIYPESELSRVGSRDSDAVSELKRALSVWGR
jgi:hypothetical protein